GIDEEYLSKVFDQYFSTKGEEGTGLGLYMIKLLIEELDGSIEVKNNDKGAVFDIKLPLTCKNS
ncbi:MAG: ATP-binding protein, partial [Campylobacterales bacterium]|nr:ATP-binding protein [Campylobacterales bacterium]